MIIKFLLNYLQGILAAATTSGFWWCAGWLAGVLTVGGRSLKWSQGFLMNLSDLPPTGKTPVNHSICIGRRCLYRSYARVVLTILVRTRSTWPVARSNSIANEGRHFYPQKEIVHDYISSVMTWILWLWCSQHLHPNPPQLFGEVHCNMHR